MENNPLVSVLMTAYNREQFIAEAIESVLASTFTNFELIIVDDCSTDKTIEIAKKFEMIDSRVKVYKNDNNLGDYLNRNMSASFAKGKYLKYLDADDLIYPHGLEVMVAAMEKYPNAVLGIQSNKREDVEPYPISSMPAETFMEHYLGGGSLLSGPTGTIIKKEIFDSVGGFSGRRFIGDTELWLKLASKYEIVKFQPALIWWRTHEDQEIRKEIESFEPSFSRYKLDRLYLSPEVCPLTSKNQKLAINKLNRRFLINIFKQFICQSDRIKTLNYLFEANLGVVNIFRAIFH